MRLTSTTFEPGGRIPQHCAFGIPDTEEHMKLGENRNPELSWSDIPDGARSLVLLCVDPDVPAVLDDVNTEGRTLAKDLPRVEFFHWVMVDISPEDGGTAEGACSDGVTPGGKDNPDGPAGSRQGINDYTAFMAGDTGMKGNYFGYDGPCPPWNDERMHHYHFILYATDLESCPVEGAFSGPDVLKAIEDHILAEASIQGTYSLNPELR